LIALLLTTHNESSMLRLNIEHHLAWGIDHVAVCDNMSADDTPDVIRKFGASASSIRFKDFRARQAIRMEALNKLKMRHSVEWAGVADTDELFWRPEGGMKELLRDVPRDVVAVTFHQKLFLPTELDPVDGSVHERRVYRTSSYSSALHSGWVMGKTFYRASWLRKITHEHFCPEVPHSPWGPPEPVVHHYMIQDEDQFVLKVRRLESWRQRSGLSLKRFVLYHRLRGWLGLDPLLKINERKKEWWSIYMRAGEGGLREYYRQQYVVSAQDVVRYVASGDLVRDAAFADWNRARRGTAPVIASGRTPGTVSSS
jgi:hypothetical protein